MATASSLVAALLYLVPIVAIVGFMSRRAEGAAAVAIAIPMAAALDLLIVLGLAFAMPLEVAALATRSVWIVVLGIAVLRRDLRWPLRRRETLIAITGALLGLALSLLVSRPYAIWDRHWHTPLATSLRAQTLPFWNVFDPREPLKYHFAGDALAATLSSLSFAVAHMALALSLAHDLCFALTGAAVALLLTALGAGRVTALLGVASVLLAGPVTVLRRGEIAMGYSFVNYLSLSFRPHVALSGLLMTGFFGVMLVRVLRRARSSPRHGALAMVATAALLSITDEASLALSGAAVGAAWLVRPQILATTRLRGAACLGALAAALVVPNLVFSGALSRGAPIHQTALVPWQLPGFFRPSLPLTHPAAREILLHDSGGLLLALIAGALVIAWGIRIRGFGATLLLLAALVGGSLLALTRLEVNHQPLESHRFMTAAIVVAPLVCSAWLARIRGGASLAGALAGRTIMVAALLLGPISTVDWLETVAPSQAVKQHTAYAADHFYQTNCRAETGAEMFERAKMTYVASRVAYLYAGCHPLFVLGTAPDLAWKLRMNSPEYGLRALAFVHRQRLSSTSDLLVECPVDGAEDQGDPVCSFARQRAPCALRGRSVLECILSPDARRALLQLPTIAR